MRILNDDTVKDFIRANSLALVMLGHSTDAKTRELRLQFESTSIQVEDISFAYCDVECAMEFATHKGVLTLPTVIAFQDAAETNRIVGGNADLLQVLITLLRESQQKDLFDPV